MNDYKANADQQMINYFKEDVRFRLNHSDDLKKWITKLFSSNKLRIANLNYIFCSDAYLKKMNKKFLNHDYFTDVITFDNSFEPKNIVADIFISIDRVAANAEKFQSTFQDELHRVMIHGALHLTGMDDKNAKAKVAMKKQEDLWLKKRKF